MSRALTASFERLTIAPLNRMGVSASCLGCSSDAAAVVAIFGAVDSFFVAGATWCTGRFMASITRRAFLGQAAATAGVLAGCPCASDQRIAADAPNIIVLLSDDQRWDSLGVMGNPFARTPNIDRFAASGTLFENAFCTTSICSASRASILTGLHTGNHGVRGFLRPLPGRLFPNTYPGVLRAAGYQTAFIGKWGIGLNVPDYQFDFFDGFPGQGQYHAFGEERHLTSVIADQAVDFLQSGATGQPFCLSVSFKAPHVQDGAPVEYDFDAAYGDLFRDEDIPSPATATPAHFGVLPEFIQTSENRTRWGLRFGTPSRAQDSLKGYYRLVAGLDAAIGRIIDAVNSAGLAENTVIVFSSDNGAFLGEHGLAGKWLMREESIRVPLVIHDPRAPASGQRRSEMALNIDLAPTVIALAGLEAPPGMQGRSLTPLLRGQDIPWRQEWYYENEYTHFGRIRPCVGIRTPDWTYTRYPETQFEELFDLQTDSLEERNLAAAPSSAAELNHFRARLQTWRDSLAAHVPVVCMPWSDPAV